MWRILQYDYPDDFVLATGKTYSVKQFVELSFKHVGIKIDWKNHGINEVGIDRKTNKELVKINKSYFRPTEVDTLIGDPSKAKKAFLEI